MLNYPYAQLELTTICNLNCFYCAGRQMPQRHMAFETFTQIIDALPPQLAQVSLQGEGEPTLHPDFKRMTRYCIDHNREPYTITNFHSSAIIERSGILDYPTFGVSLDSLDDAILQKIGRSVHTRANIEKYITDQRVEIYTVSFGQDIRPVARWCQQRGFRHLVQPLQTKPDYVATYQIKGFRQVAYNDVPHQLSCPHMHTYSPYFTVTGEERPCCYIKTPQCAPRKEMQDKMRKGIVPPECQGCHLLGKVKNAPAVSV